MWSVTLEEEFKKNPELKPEFIKEIREWLETQKHLPEIEDLEIVMFLKACEWNLKETKDTIEAFFTYRTNMPEFFSARDPTSKELQDISQTVHVTVLPQTDLEGNQILWGRLIDSDSSKYSFTSAAKYFVMTSEVLQLQKGTFPGIVLVYDVKHLTLSHLIKTPVTIMNKYANYAQEAASFPVRGIHYINTNSVLDKLILIARPFLRSRILSSKYEDPKPSDTVPPRVRKDQQLVKTDPLHLHSDPETLFKHIPKKIVPKDYGGEEKSLKDLNDLNMENLICYRQWFLDEEKKRVDETKRSRKKADKGDTKVLASFKKLELD